MKRSLDQKTDSPTKRQNTKKDLKWTIAEDETGNLVHVSEANKGITYMYRLGEQIIPLVFRKCNPIIRRDHFACVSNLVFAGMSDWHLFWQGLAKPEYREVCVSSKRADIRNPNLGLTIEIQSSPIAQSDVQERNKTHGKIVWILNATNVHFENIDLKYMPRLLSFSVKNLKSMNVVHCFEKQQEVSDEKSTSQKTCFDLFLDIGLPNYVFKLEKVENKIMTGSLYQVSLLLQFFYSDITVSSAFEKYKKHYAAGKNELLSTIFFQLNQQDSTLSKLEEFQIYATTTKKDIDSKNPKYVLDDLRIRWEWLFQKQIVCTEEKRPPVRAVSSQEWDAFVNKQEMICRQTFKAKKNKNELESLASRLMLFQKESDMFVREAEKWDSFIGPEPINEIAYECDDYKVTYPTGLKNANSFELPLFREKIESYQKRWKSKQVLEKLDKESQLFTEEVRKWEAIVGPNVIDLETEILPEDTKTVPPGMMTPDSFQMPLLRNKIRWYQIQWQSKNIFQKASCQHWDRKDKVRTCSLISDDSFYVCERCYHSISDTGERFLELQRMKRFERIHPNIDTMTKVEMLFEQDFANLCDKCDMYFEVTSETSWRSYCSGRCYAKRDEEDLNEDEPPKKTFSEWQLIHDKIASQLQDCRKKFESWRSDRFLKTVLHKTIRFCKCCNMPFRIPENAKKAFLCKPCYFKTRK